MVNADYYISVLKQLIKDRIPKKHKDLIKNWKLHQDNARPHVAQAVQDFLTQKNIEMVPHPPYSTDLAPNNFFLYSTAKKDLKGRRFSTSTVAVKVLGPILKRLSSQRSENVFVE